MFTDRLLVTLVHLRLGLPHAALARLDRGGVTGSTSCGWTVTSERTATT
ncbi:hypothetical protein ABZZ79_37655 [Streptomyces sp. NPDC006458]